MNIYLIESPFQLLAAYELVDDIQSANNIFLVRLNDNEKNNAQIKELIKIIDLKKIYYFKTRNILHILNFIFPFMVLSFFSKNDLWATT